MEIKEQLMTIFPDQDKIRQKDFPLLDSLNRVYLDNTATSQEPMTVLKKMYHFRRYNLRGSNHSENSEEAKNYDHLVTAAREK